jgi:serine protease AprX
MNMKKLSIRNLNMRNTSFTFGRRSPARFIAACAAGTVALSVFASLNGSSPASAAELPNLQPGSHGTEMIVMATPGELSRVVSTLERTGVKVGRRLPVINGVTITAKSGSESAIEHLPGVKSVTDDGWVTPVDANLDTTGAQSSMKADRRSRAAAAAAAKDRAGRNRAERERAEREKAEQEKAEQAARDRAAEEQAAKDQAAKDQESEDVQVEADADQQQADQQQADQQQADQQQAVAKAAEAEQARQNEAAKQETAKQEAAAEQAKEQATDTEDNGTSASGSRDTGSLESIARATGARKMWRRGFTGQGVDVALIDTGVVAVTGGPTVINGADLSTDAGNPALKFLDGYGHGTHMAGIIAGQDAGADPLRQQGAFVGIAPDSRIVNVKVAGMDGRVHVSQVVAAIDWVVQNKHANGMNIRVINLAYSAPATGDWQRDPLAWAAEVAWRKGIVVVAAAGNEGTDHELSSPAYSPEILAVGASEIEAARGSTHAYTIAPYSSTGTRRRPDLFVPGSHVVSLRAKGSFIDTFLAKANVSDRLTRGSGTSQASAVASGLVALLIQKFPTATPDQIKKMLSEGTDVSESHKDVTGLRASIDVWAAAKSAKKGLPTVASTDPFAECVAGQWCRGNADGAPNFTEWAQASWNGSSWTGSSWTGSSWTGSSWTGSSWTDNAWNGSSWTGSSWTGSSWTGSSWTTSTWNGSSWTAATWDGATWTANGWAGTSWSGTSWSGTSWSGTSWSGTQWSGNGWGG